MRTGFGGHPQVKSVVGSGSFASQKNLRCSLSLVTEAPLGDGLNCCCTGCVASCMLLEACSVSVWWLETCSEAEEALLNSMSSVTLSLVGGSIVVGDSTTVDPSKKILGLLLNSMSNRGGLDSRDRCGRGCVTISKGLSWLGKELRGVCDPGLA